MTRAAATTEILSAPMLLADYDFDLPAENIAQEPAAERDSARLMVLERSSGERQHAAVRGLPSLLASGDLLVFNDTRVIPARLRGRLPAGSVVELLLAHRVDSSPIVQGAVWRCLGKPGRRLHAGAHFTVGDGERAEIVANHGDGFVDVRFAVDDILPLLERHGEIPLPPYIRRDGGPQPSDADRYQTMFATTPGAVAAPTAGLHFTESLLADLRTAGVQIATLTLHVGPGTFLPVRCADARDHVMLPERYEISDATVEMIRQTKANGRRVVAVGTTTTRALESAALDGDLLHGRKGWADCFLYPGCEFRIVDGLLTNFHLPRSTLLLLVSAFAGREAIRAAYADAIERDYRFYSYGDAMLIR